MTQKQFKESLLRGQGRCVKAVQADPEKYYSAVLWACSHEVAFDPQCEGSRAWFVYQLICCYPDRRPFLEVAVASIQKTNPSTAWKILYLAELLSHFAADGEDSAETALWDKYEELLAALMRKRRLPTGVFPERDDFFMLCQVLADDRSAMVKIAEDIGRLCLARDFYDGGDFDWLFSTWAKRYMGTLKKQAEKSENIAQFLRAGYAEEEAWKARAQKPFDPGSGRKLSRWLKKTADPQTVQTYAQAYLAQTDPAARAEALEAFFACPYPNDPAPIIQDANSPHPKLKEVAWQALENIRHPLVRQFAVEQMRKDPEMALPIFLANYQPQDENLLVDMVKVVKTDFACTTAWHSVQGDVLGMKDHGLKPPAVLLQHIYETTYCSCCREDALRQMGKRKLLTNAVLEECLQDSNDDIRAYAKSILARRGKKTTI